MFDVYLNQKRDRLLVLTRGKPIPLIENSGRWRKKKTAIAVSDEIKLALQKDGFYWRRLAGHRNSDALPSSPASPHAGNDHTGRKTITGFFETLQNGTD